MIQNLNLGPPARGVPTLKSTSENRSLSSKEVGSESFGLSLQAKMRDKDKQSPIEHGSRMDRKESLSNSNIDKPKKYEKPSQKESARDSDEAPDKGLPLRDAQKAKANDEKPELTKREKAIKKFMDSFESEFGIPPTRLVESIAQLDEADLLKSPEETSEKVIGQLGLDEKDQDRAQAMYASLLLALKQNPEAKPKAAILAAGGAGGAMAVDYQQRMQLANKQRDATNMGIDRLNQKFWMKSDIKDVQPNLMKGMDAKSFAQMGVDESSMSELQNSPDNLQESGDLQPNAKNLELPPHIKGQLAENASPTLMAALAAKWAQLKAQKSQDGENESAVDNTEMDDGYEKPAVSSRFMQGPQAATAVNGESAQGGSLSSYSEGRGGQHFANEFEQKGLSTKAHASAVTKANLKTEFKNALSGADPSANPNVAKPELPGSAGAEIKGAEASPLMAHNSNENETNIRQLMNQAQYLIKKGGGEVKVQMTPEGLGPVHLKVMMQDGKVNVQMSATTDEAKKTIESSLAELKTSLAAHKLSVEHVKVDVVNSASADTATQNQTNMNSQREGTRQFWNQFNDSFGSGNQRDSFLEMTGVKGYSQPSKDPLRPIQETDTSRRSVSGKGQGLNLVA